MKTLLVATLVLALALATGCVRFVEGYTVTFRSTTGVELAKGQIMLSSPLPATGTIRGWYKLEMRHVRASSKDIEAFYQLFKGKESGQVEWVVGRVGTTASRFDFMPSSAEGSVIASATQMARGYWSGRWSYTVFTGEYSGGSIDIARK